MDVKALETLIDAAFEDRDSIGFDTQGEVRDGVNKALEMLDNGTARVAEPQGNHQWHVNQWLKKAVLLSFRLNDMQIMPGGAGHPQAGESVWWDKVPSKFSGWDEARFRDAAFRAVPGAIVRHSAFIAPSVVLMPSFVNLGAYVGEGTMVDTWRRLAHAHKLARMFIFQAARVLAACLNLCKQVLLSLKIIALLVLVLKWLKVWLSKKALYYLWVSLSVPRRKL